MRVGPCHILAFCCALAAPAAAHAEEKLPQAAEWEGPLVVVTLKDETAPKQTGYLMSYQGGRMLFRPLDKGRSDEEFTSAQIENLTFLPPPPKPPAAEPRPEARTEPKPDGRTEPSGPDRPFAGMRLREKLEKARDFFELPSVEKLSPRERERYRELTVRHPGKHTQDEMQELNTLRGKMDLPPLEAYRLARNEAYKAKTAEQVEAFMEGKRRELAASKSADEARRTLLGIMYLLKAQEDSPEDYLASLQKTLNEETARIRDAEARAEVRGSLRELITDFVAQNLRFEKDREDRPALRPLR
ncbi:MAG: hypothetical protein KIS92_23030 [Planctomycetota bacterium]|nr:hypothetical protein [Planctomycetota bacterium]